MLSSDGVDGEGAVDTLLEWLGLGADLSAVEGPLGVHGLVSSDDWQDDLVTELGGDGVGQFLVEGWGLLVVLLGSTEFLDHTTDIMDAPLERNFVVLTWVGVLGKVSYSSALVFVPSEWTRCRC